MAGPARGKKAPAAGSAIRQGRTVKDNENAPVRGREQASAEGATAPAAKRGRPAKITKTPPHHTPQDHTQQTVPPTSNATANDSVQSTNEAEQENIALRKRIAEMEAQIKSGGEGADTIRAILKPNGEAGDKRNGFVLRDVMELNGSHEKQQIYLAILRSARRNILRANLDIAVDFRRQDHEKLGQVFKMMRKENPYLDKRRFPRDWATAEIVKQYLRNQRKQAKKAGRNQHNSDEGDAGGRNSGDIYENGNHEGGENGEDED